METIGSYRLTEKISEGRLSELFRAERASDGLRVVIRLLRSPGLSAADAARFKKQFENIANLEIEGIVRLYELFEHEDGFALVMEDFRGSSLKSRIGPAGMDFGEALDIAVRLAEILGRIHEKWLVHKAVKPSNILIEETRDSCRITDFGDLSLIAKEHEDIYAPGMISGTLPYMAPEQTGRMNRAVDRRTDLYCLGAVLYEMLTGSVVFVSDDPMEIIHAHIAKPPVSPSEARPGIPGALSDVVMKLLLKAPEDRYQSARGLLADLEHCRRGLAKEGTIKPFELASEDVFLDFDSPGRLVGRENEITALVGCFDRVMEFRRPGAAIITGPEGIGKSALAETVCRSAALDRGYFIAGRYDRFRGEVPYSAIIQAFMSLVSRLLAEGPERIESWKKRISEALGAGGRVITEVIPNLELIVGKQPEVPELGPEAARNRFVHVFTNFVQVFASSAHPLILFLDDLQWADRESLRFLGRLVEGMDKGCIWLVLAYRDTESEGSDLLVRTIGKIENTVGNTIRVQPGTLDREAVGSMISAMLKIGRDAAAPFASVVHEKTGGSPFFVNQFLKNLYENNYLRFDPSRGWSWDEEQISGLEVTDNVVELMTGKLSDLPDKTRDILKTGACIGNRFDLETLAAVRGMDMDEVMEAAEPALKSGYLQYSEGMYRFVHDRLWEAAYAMIPAQDRSRLHHDIGWHVYRSTEDRDELYKNIFFIVNHLNAGRDSITGYPEKKETARLNLLAGEKSRDTAAYQSALDCLRTGISLLDYNAWTQDYTLALKLHTEVARAAYLNTAFEEMEERVNQIVNNAKTVLDTIDAREIQIQAYLARRKIAEAVGIAYMVLDDLGVRLPRRASSARRSWELFAARRLLYGRKDHEIVNYRVMDDPYARAAVRIATSSLMAFYIGGYATDMAVLVLRMVRISFSKGVCAQTPHWLGSYSVMLFAMNRLDEARRFGDLALEMARRLGSRETQIMYLVYAQTRHWRDPLAECCRDILEIYHRGLELGDVDYSVYSAGQYCHMAFGAGRRLNVLAGETQSYGSVIRRYGQMVPLHLILMLQQVIGKLRKDSDNFEILEGQRYSEEELTAEMVESGERAGLFLIYTYRLMICFVFGEHERAEQNAEKAKGYLDAGVGLYMFAVFYFYRALNQLAVFERLPHSRKKEVWKKIEKAASKLRLWAAHGPKNHGHKSDLVEAEMARVRGDLLNAENLYHKAADRARENGFIQIEALACELAALFYSQRAMRDFGTLFMVRSHECYRKWGASAKTEQLEKIRSDFLQAPAAMVSRGREDDRDPGQDQGAGLDLSTVIKAYQAISGEIVLERLLERLMRIGLENAGGRRAVLLLENSGRLHVEAESDSAGNVRVLQSVPVEDYPDIPAGIVSYVHKTMENIVIDDASSDERFSRDPYISDNSVKSVLCAPIRRGKELSGLFYVENSLASGAFSSNRLELLTLLSSQAAIAIENAKLFEMARRDGLTGLINHRYFYYTLEKELRKASGENYPVWLFMIDIDHFKDFNDTYGHQAGDEVLRQVAAIIQANLPDRDLVSRYGGEEFSVIYPEKSLDEAGRLAEKIRTDIEANVTHYRGKDLKVTISIGVAGTFLAGAASADTLIRMADSALYKAKAEGRNRVAIHS